MRKLEVNNVITTLVRKTAKYRIIEVNEDKQYYLMRRVNKLLEDAGDKTTYRVPFKQMEQIFESVVSSSLNQNQSKAPSVQSPKEDDTAITASKLIETVGFFERDGVNLLKRVACEFSPENLTYDGELRGQALNNHIRDLNRKWKALEMYFGKKIINDLI